MMAWKYKRLTTMVIGQRLELIESKDIIDLVGKKMDYIHLMLSKTPYQIELQEIHDKQLDSASIENVLLKNYIKTCEVIKDNSPKNIRFLLSAILKKYEINNIKAIFRAKWAGISVNEAMKFITPFGNMDEQRCKSIFENSKSVIDVIEHLSDVEYGPVLKEALSNHKDAEVLQVIETFLNNYVYKEIYKAVGKLKGRDRKIAETVLGIEIDSKNIMIILRSISLKIPKDQIKHYLLPTSQIFSEKELEAAIETNDTQSSIESLLNTAKSRNARDYQYMLTELLTEYKASPSLSNLEVTLDRSLLKTSLIMLKRYTPYFNIGLILAFLNAKWFEVRNLRAILRGAESDLRPEQIMKLLILPN
ncbi:MAG: V-type ATPase subunit [Candidatus Bathyarchaeia archaeon]